MPEFRYKAVNEKGREIKGKIIAYSQDDVISQLKEQGVYLIEINEKGKVHGKNRKIKRKELLSFTTQFYSLVRSSVPLLKGLSDVAQETKNSHFRNILTEIIERVRAGENLSQAFSEYPEVFPGFYVGAVRTGEMSGTLSMVLKDIIDILERQEEFEAELKQALTYPSIAVFTLTGVAMFYLFYILPKVIGLVKDMGIDLPMQTKILLTFVTVSKQFWYMPLCALIGLIIAFFAMRRTEKGGLAIDRFFLGLPILGKIMKKSLMARFSRFLSLLLRAGIDIVTSLEILTGITGNRVIKSAIKLAKEKLVTGSSLSESFSMLPYSLLSLSMISVGEETGRLSEELTKVAEYNQKEVENTTKRAITYIEPAMLVTFGLFAGIIFLSVLMPIYDAVAKVTAAP